MRKFLGAAAMLIWLVAYIAVMAVIGDRVVHEAWYIQVLFFPVAGIAWVIPIKPLLHWMHARDEPKESPDV